MKNFFYWSLVCQRLSDVLLAAEFCGHKMAAKRPHGPCLLWGQRCWFSHLVSRKTVAHSGDSTDTPIRLESWFECVTSPVTGVPLHGPQHGWRLWSSEIDFHVNFDDGIVISVSGRYFQDRDESVVLLGGRGGRTKKQGVTAPSPWGHWDWESWCERLEWRSVHSALVWCPAARRWTERPLPAATQTRASWTRSGRAAGSWACGSWAAWRRSPRSEPCCRGDLAHPGRRRPWRRAEAGWGGVLGSAGLEVGEGEEPVLGLGTTGRGAGACGATWGVGSAGRQRRAPSAVATEICWIKDGLIKTTQQLNEKTNKQNKQKEQNVILGNVFVRFLLVVFATTWVLIPRLQFRCKYL